MKLKNLIERKGRLTEEVIEPSEQVIKGVQKELKLKTGIIAVLGLNKKSPSALYYTTDLSKEIRTPILQALFATLSLDVTCRQIPNSIGGYAFDVSINYTHPQKGSNGLDIGTIWYMDGKFKSKFKTEARASETPY
jgi:hypothetical protein